MSENPAFAAILNQGLFGIGKPSFEVFKDISSSHAFGFFGTSPFMWLGVVAVPAVVLIRKAARHEQRQDVTSIIACALIMLILFVTVSAAANWRGGWTVGPRYLGAAPPFFAFAAVLGAERLADSSLVRRTAVRGVFGGLAIASVVQIGWAGLLYNTIPESVTRPLPQFVLPFMRAGFVPHHAGELVGLDGPGTWYVVAGAMLLAAVIAAMLPYRDGVATYAARTVLVVSFAWIGLRPAFSEPKPEEAGDGGAEARSLLSNAWEPAGRDYLAKWRGAATTQPCLWYRVADLERDLGMQADAERDEKKAGRPRDKCR